MSTTPSSPKTDQRSSLLEQLRIDRGDGAPRSRSGLLWIGAAAAVAVMAAVAAWLLLSPRSGATSVTAAAAMPPVVQPKVVDAHGGSILDASGYVVARRQATVSSKITGKVAAVLIEEGQRVEAGEVMARLDDTNARAQVEQAAAQLEQQRANLRAATVALDNAAPTFARNRQQFEGAFISAQAFDAAKTTYDATRTAVEVAAGGVAVAKAGLALAQRALDDTVVRAPFAGIVTVKAAQPGEMVSPVSAGGGFTRTGIGTIVDMDSLEVEVDVSENFINRVVSGQGVTITLNAYPDERAAGRVIAIVPTADRAKATVKVRVGFEAKDGRILPEMGARVAFLADDAVHPSPALPGANL
jgi:RND family efflux transporter MFP subunit